MVTFLNTFWMGWQDALSPDGPDGPDGPDSPDGPDGPDGPDTFFIRIFQQRILRSYPKSVQGCNHSIPVAIFSTRGWTYRNLRNSPGADWTLKVGHNVYIYQYNNKCYKKVSREWTYALKTDVAIVLPIACLDKRFFLVIKKLHQSSNYRNLVNVFCQK